MKFQLFIIGLALTGVVTSEAPKLRWLSERSESGIPLLEITFNERRADFALLSQYNPIPIELDETRSAVDECIFHGTLKNDDSASLTVVGCPHSKNFEVAIASSANNLHLQVKDGQVEIVQSPLGKDFASYGLEVPETLKTSELNVSSRAFPSNGFIFNLALFLDPSWRTKYGNDAVNAARRLVALTQPIFRWTSLTVPFTLNVLSITNVNVNLPAQSSGLNALLPFATNANAHSHVGLSAEGVYGGIAYVGAVCGTLSYRRAVVRTGPWADSATAEIMAHELGHNLNMPHDFIDPYQSPKTIRRDSSGRSCTDNGGVMDYYVSVNKWSTCSVEKFTEYYNNVVRSKGSFCMSAAGFAGSEPFYRYYKSGGEHFYTLRSSEIGTTTPGQVGKYGYKSEGVACHIMPNRVSGSKPLYRYWNGRNHFYTLNAQEIGTTTPGQVGKYNYKSEGIAGYCFPSRVSGSVPFYRYYRGSPQDHFYTRSAGEIGTTTPGVYGKYGYRSEGIACYVYP